MELAGAGAVVYGVGMIFLPAAVIMAGIGIVFIAQGMEGDDGAN